LLRLATKDLVEQRRKRELERFLNPRWKRRSKIIRSTLGRPVAEEAYSEAKFTKEDLHLQAKTKVFISQS
jgi:hypothetical protein